MGGPSRRRNPMHINPHADEYATTSPPHDLAGSAVETAVATRVWSPHGCGHQPGVVTAQSVARCNWFYIRSPLLCSMLCGTARRAAWSPARSIQGRRLATGSHSVDLDDDVLAGAAAGELELRLVSSGGGGVTYDWQGVLGNTGPLNGPGALKGLNPPLKIQVVGDRAVWGVVRGHPIPHIWSIFWRQRMRRHRKTWIGLKNPPLRRFSWYLSFSGALLRHLLQQIIDNLRAVPGTPIPPPYVHF